MHITTTSALGEAPSAPSGRPRLASAPASGARSGSRQSARARHGLVAWLSAMLLAAGGGALAQGFAGVFQGSSDAGPVTVELSLAGTDLSGRLSAPGLEIALEGYVQDGVGVGYAHTAEGTLGFEAHLEGATLGLYLFEMDSSGAPVVESVIELLLERQAEAGPGSDQVLATGSYAALTHDAAAAFIEALEFVLAQIGYAYSFTDADRSEALRAIAANYASMPQRDQVTMAHSREIWERVKVNWPTAAPADQREFALGVLILAFGEGTVSAWVGQDGGGRGPAGGSACTTFEDCTSSFVDGQTWSDTAAAQGCWAAAGCNGFDPSTNTFDYDTY